MTKTRGIKTRKEEFNESAWARTMAPYVGVISSGPATGYVRERVPQMVAAGVPMPVAVFQATADYVASSPINPDKPVYSACPVCGRPAKAYAGVHGSPSMAICDRCNRAHIVRDNEAPATIAAADDSQDSWEWWND